MADSRVPTDLIGPSEAAALVSVGPKTISRWLRTGKVTCYRMPSGQRKVSRSELLALVSVTPVSA